MKKVIIESFNKIDFVVWGFTILFFLVSAFLGGGNLEETFSGASGIIVLMFLVGLSIEFILLSLKDVKGLGKITGFITNGPEALVLIIGLISGNVIFAASTPLGSNVMNPILLIIALVITGFLFKLKYFKYKIFFIISFLITGFLAVSFFALKEEYYIFWLIISLVLSLLLFNKKFDAIETEEHDISTEKYYLPLGIVLLLISGYFLDPVVNFTAEVSKAPKGVIGFVVLATLTSWPEFKSVLGLLKRERILDAFINILVSNITNLWLAMAGVIIWYFTK